jgi:short-subunit dehydrogenase
MPSWSGGLCGQEEGDGVRLDDSVALVTGASSGIGRAVAMSLARRGSRVVVHGRDEQRTKDVAGLVAGTALLADLLEDGAPERLAERAAAVHGRVDLLVCNAGAGLSAPLTDLSVDDVQRLIALDLAAPIRLVRALLPAMVERDRGCIVLVSSVAGRVGVAGESVYAAAKAGLDAFAESLRLELHGTAVGVTTVVPGVVDTPFFDARGGPPMRRVPRPVGPERVAESLVRAVSHDRDEVWVPSWLRVSPAVRAAAPGAFHRMSARFGEPVRIRRRGEPT